MRGTTGTREMILTPTRPRVHRWSARPTRRVPRRPVRRRTGSDGAPGSSRRPESPRPTECLRSGGTMTSTQAPPVSQPPGGDWPRGRPRPRGRRRAGRVRTGAPRQRRGDPTFGFCTLLAMKTWLTTAAMIFLVVQVISALAMWGRLPGVSGHPPGRPAASMVRRRRVRADPAGRVPVHLVAGLLRRLRPHPGPFPCRLPVLRGVRRQDAVPAAARPARLDAARARRLAGRDPDVVWFSSAFWYFTQPGLPLW